MAQATVATGSARAKGKPRQAVAAYIPDCPMMAPDSERLYQTARKAAAAHSKDIRTFLQPRDAKAQAAWLKASTVPHKTLFQPWSLEILFLTASRDQMRFSEYEDMLGISSRTLSTKLRSLTDEGFLERIVYDEQPVRIEYRCTKHGKWTAALATPLFTHLNLHTMSGANQNKP